VSNKYSYNEFYAYNDCIMHSRDRVNPIR
jgi:hypothetical protein